MVLRVTVVVAVLSAACGGGSPDESRAAQPAAPVKSLFSERAVESGLDFVHFNGMSGRRYYPEIFGPGVGLIDIDNDGDLDVYVVQGQMLGSAMTVADATIAPKGELRDRLFRNDLKPGPDGRTVARFTDITAQSGIDIRTYGMGVAAGDFDNDGWTDIYRTGLGGAVLLRNNGNGTFNDFTSVAGAANAGSWGVSAAFVDYDRDGWLDIYVGNYVDYQVSDAVECVSLSGQPEYCPPRKYKPQRDRLYRNRGDLTFEDVTARALTGGVDGPGLGVSTADFNKDGWIDIYVGNDGTANQLWLNQHDGTFTDAGLKNGAAVNASGAPEASKGIDAGDFDNDGDEDLFITNWASEMNILYENTGDAVFEDRKAASGLGGPSVSRTGFGTAWFDYDNDGWLDLLTVNGSVAAIEAQRARDVFPFRMSNQLFRNGGNGQFEDVSARAGPAFSTEQVGRGAAFGDIDNDGDTDVVIGTDAGPLQLLINDTGSRSHWVGLRFVGTEGRRRDMLGARVAIVRADGVGMWRRVRSDGSYASANDPRVLAGLGQHSGAVRVFVQWPNGKTDEWSGIPADRWTVLTEGTGK